MRQQPTDRTASLSPQDNGQPPYLYPDYVSTRLRAPKGPLIILPNTLSDTTGPAYGRGPIGELDHDLTRQHEGEPFGERIIVTGASRTATAALCGEAWSRSGRPTPQAATPTTSTGTRPRLTRTFRALDGA